MGHYIERIDPDDPGAKQIFLRAIPARRCIERRIYNSNQRKRSKDRKKVVYKAPIMESGEEETPSNLMVHPLTAATLRSRETRLTAEQRGWTSTPAYMVCIHFNIYHGGYRKIPNRRCISIGKCFNFNFFYFPTMKSYLKGLMTIKNVL